MQRVNSEIIISASIDQVWQVVSDLGSYQKWNSQLRLLDGDVELGERVKIRLKPLYYRSAKSSAVISDMQPVTRFGLNNINIIPGLLKLECLFTLSRIDEHTTSLHLHQRFYGVLAFLVDKRARSIEAKKSCYKMNAETKRRVEDLLKQNQEPAILSA